MAVGAFRASLARQTEFETQEEIAEEIAQEYGVSTRTIFEWNRKFDLRGTLERKEGSGRPTRYSDDHIASIKEYNRGIGNEVANI